MRVHTLNGRFSSDLKKNFLYETLFRNNFFFHDTHHKFPTLLLNGNRSTLINGKLSLNTKKVIDKIYRHKKTHEIKTSTIDTMIR